MAFSFANISSTFKNRAQIVRKRAVAFIDQRPLLSFFGLLGFLFLLIVLSSFLRQPPAAEEATVAEPKAVSVYSSAEVPTMTFSAKIEKSGVINIYAQSPGIVQSIKLKEGSRVSRGGTLVGLSTNYQGGNVSSLSRQIAQKNFEFASENFDAQKEIIAKQRELALKGDIQADELRSINRQSLDDTRSLISLNEEILRRLDEQIAFLQATNVNGNNNASILGALQGKAGAQSGLTQLRSGLRMSEYQSSDSNTSAQMGDLSKDVAVKQLDLQEKSLTLAKDISEINLKLARVSESLMYPAAPCAGVVERIHVKIGQSVAPGTLIATIKADAGENSAMVFVNREVAQQISRSEPSKLVAGEKTLELLPRYISTEATEGSLYSVMYDIPREFGTALTNAELVKIQVPVGAKTLTHAGVTIPLDAVYQTQDKAYVSVVVQDGEELKAKTVEVELGAVSGASVEVRAGLKPEDKIITSRNVQDGDRVRVL